MTAFKQFRYVFAQLRNLQDITLAQSLADAS